MSNRTVDEYLRLIAPQRMRPGLTDEECRNIYAQAPNLRAAYIEVFTREYTRPERFWGEENEWRARLRAARDWEKMYE